MCAMMQFRQRVAWLLLAFFLLASAGALYYLFEISARFSLFALEHAEQEHSRIDGSLLRLPQTDTQTLAVSNQNAGTAGYIQSALSHVMDLPATMLILLLLVVYIQVCSKFY